MENIYYLLFVALIFWYFVYLRRVSEYARSHANKYCKQENLQFLAIARLSSKFRFSKRYGPHWISQFDLEFSGDGESKYHGTMTLRGYKLDKIDTPAYRV